MTVLQPALAELDLLSPEAPGRPVLSRCLTLALLLHVLVVVVFGNTPGGTALPGQGVWGAINIRLAGGDPAGRDSTTVASDAYSGPEGVAAQRRWGGAVRAPQDLPQAHAEPGAARLGTWQPQAGELAPAERVEAAAPAVPDPAPPQPAAPADMRATPPAPAAPAVRLAPPQPTVEALPLPAPELALPAPAPAPVAAPPPRPLPPLPRAAPVPLAADRMPALTGEVTAPLPTLPAPAPPEPPRRVAPVLAAPAPLAPLAAPSLPAPNPAAAAALVPALPAPVATDAPTPVRPAPAPAPAPITPVEPPRAVPLPAAPTPLAPLSRTALQTPVDARAVPVPDVPALPTPGGPAQPALASPPTPSVARTAAGAGGGELRPSNPTPSPGAGARIAPPSPGGGAPDQGARVGHDLATAPSLPASAAKLNLELVRPRGGLISSQGSRGLLPTVPHPPEAKSKLAEEIQKAGKVDCRKAYADMGVAAAAPLVLDALRDKGCRW